MEISFEIDRFLLTDDRPFSTMIKAMKDLFLTGGLWDDKIHDTTIKLHR